MPTILETPIVPPEWTTQRISNWVILWQRDPETGLIDPNLVDCQIEVETLNAEGESVRHETYHLAWNALPAIVRDGMKDMHEYLISRCKVEGWIGIGTDEPEW